jgi:hypothetical protein
VARAHEAFRAPVYLHPGDRLLYEAADQQAAFFGLSLDTPPPAVWPNANIPGRR